MKKTKYILKAPIFVRTKNRKQTWKRNQKKAHFYGYFYQALESCSRLYHGYKNLT